MGSPTTLIRYTGFDNYSAHVVVGTAITTQIANGSTIGSAHCGQIAR
jgi:hypothetical protein